MTEPKAKETQILDAIKMCRKAEVMGLTCFANLGYAKEPIGSFVCSSNFPQPKFSIAGAILDTCKDAGIKGVDFSSMCRPNMTVADFYRMKLAIWDHLIKSPGDAVFVSCDNLLTIECLDYMHRHKSFSPPLFDLSTEGKPVRVDPPPVRAVGWIYRNDDFCVITDTVKDLTAVKQVMKSIGVSEEESLECSVCFTDLHDGKNAVGHGSSKFICGHVTCFDCASKLDSCPVCREDKLAAPVPIGYDEEDAPDDDAAAADSAAAAAADSARRPANRRRGRGRGRARGFYR